CPVPRTGRVYPPRPDRNHDRRQSHGDLVVDPGRPLLQPADGRPDRRGAADQGSDGTADPDRRLATLGWTLIRSIPPSTSNSVRGMPGLCGARVWLHLSTYVRPGHDHARDVMVCATERHNKTDAA